MDVATVAYYSLVELSHKKRGSYVAGLTDVDKKVADTSFPERPLEAIDSFRSRMTETGLAGGQVLFLAATQPRKVSVLVSEFRPFLSFRIVTYIDGRNESVLSPNVKKYMKIRGGTASILLDDVPDFDSLKIPFFLRSDNQYIVKSADFSG